MLQSRELHLAEAIDIVSKVRLGQLREVDHNEFVDHAGGRVVAFPEDYGTILAAGVGLLRPDVVTLYWTLNGNPAFLATCSRLEKDSALLCGIAWADADDSVTRKERREILLGTVGALILQSPSLVFYCYVRNDNVDTLKSWEIIRKLESERLCVAFLSSEMRQDYTIVKITKRSV